jgi:hypothetical protein
VAGRSGWSNAAYVTRTPRELGARLAGIKRSGYGAPLEEGKAAFLAALAGYKAWLATVPPDKRPR